MTASERVEELAAENVRLREALETLADYAWHKELCRDFDGSGDLPCTCGYEEATNLPGLEAA